MIPHEFEVVNGFSDRIAVDWHYGKESLNYRPTPRQVLSRCITGPDFRAARHEDSQPGGNTIIRDYAHVGRLIHSGM